LIRVQEAEGLRVIELDRPEKLNALTLGMVEGLRDLLRDASDDAAVRGVILAGAGRSFCAGVDLAEFAEGTPESAQLLITALAEACDAALRCPKPVAAAIHGHCLGGALELACACDFRVAAEGARLGMPEVAVGIPSVIHAALIQRHIGLGRAQELLLTGDLIDAERAYAWGLVNRVVRAGRRVESAAELLGRVNRHDPAAIARQKRLHVEWQELGLAEAVDRSRADLVESFASGVPQRISRRRLEERLRKL
jgi:enoyl-CoA hydratase/carnithine racemase